MAREEYLVLRIENGERLKKGINTCMTLENEHESFDSIILNNTWNCLE